MCSCATYAKRDGHALNRPATAVRRGRLRHVRLYDATSARGLTEIRRSATGHLTAVGLQLRSRTALLAVQYVSTMLEAAVADGLIATNLARREAAEGRCAAGGAADGRGDRSPARRGAGLVLGGAGARRGRRHPSERGGWADVGPGRLPPPDAHGRPATRHAVAASVVGSDDVRAAQDVERLPQGAPARPRARGLEPTSRSSSAALPDRERWSMRPSALRWCAPMAIPPDPRTAS
jgi:hypothetical protein